MKKGKLLSIMMLMMMMSVVTGCSKDKEENNKPVDMKAAIGTWMCIESYDTYQGQAYTGLLVGTEITINANGTYTSNASSSTSVMGRNGTYTVNGNSITAKNTSGYTFVIDVAINGNNMRWTGTASNGVNFNYLFRKE